MAKTAQPKPDRRKSAPRKKAVVTTAGGEPVSHLTVSEAAIAARAFEHYCSRGGEHGRDMDDWLAAERELRRGDGGFATSRRESASPSREP